MTQTKTPPKNPGGFKARLVANAITHFNSKILSNLLDSSEEQGSEKYKETEKGASPVAWENINFRVTYTGS